MEKINISQHLQKQYWKRRINPTAINRHIPIKTDFYATPDVQEINVDYYTQEDFMRENESSAHEINSRVMSTRPVWDERPIYNPDGTPKLDEEGNPVMEWYVKELDKIETVRYGLQQRINQSFAAYMFGGGVWINHEDAAHDEGNILNSWKDTVGFDAAMQEVGNSLYYTCDAALYLYSQGNTIQYEVFSYLKGDMLFPDFDENRKPILYRLYTLRGKQAVDIYACGYIETWIQGDKNEDNNEKDLNWMQRFSGWFREGLKWNSTTKSEDGWRRLARTETQISNDLNQCIYFRRDDLPSGIVQEEINKLESAASFVADGVKSVSQATLFIKATDIASMPPMDSTGKIIGVNGSVDELKAADAKYLVPPQLSDIAKIDIENKKESILKSAMMVEITPDIFRSGADSSAAMKLLFTDITIWCKNEFPRIFPQLKYAVEVFKALVAKMEGNGKIATMRTSCGLNYWIPQNDSEALKRELDQVYARVKSRKAAMADIPNNHIEDYEQIKKEWEEEIRMKSEIPAEVNAEYGETEPNSVNLRSSDNPSGDNRNPDRPGVNKSASGRSIKQS